MNKNVDESLSERARAAVERAYRQHGDRFPSQNPICTDEMLDLLLEQDPDSADPLCLFRYFGISINAEWHIFGAEPRGSYGGRIHFWGLGCLGDPEMAEVGLIPFDKAEGMGLRDVRPLVRGLAGVELDRHFQPKRLSVLQEALRQQAERQRAREHAARTSNTTSSLTKSGPPALTRSGPGPEQGSERSA